MAYSAENLQITPILKKRITMRREKKSTQVLSMSSCSHCPPLAKPASHRQILAHYIKHRCPQLDAELAWFAQPQSIGAAISRAAAAKGEDGKRLSHQCRLLKTVIPTASAKLRRAVKTFQRARTFDELFNMIQVVIGHIPGVGPLYVYDTALRLGAFLGLQPAEVYLHAGARDGAKRLLGNFAVSMVPLTQFPAVFHVLSPYEMENLLCCYRGHL